MMWQIPFVGGMLTLVGAVAIGIWISDLIDEKEREKNYERMDFLMDIEKRVARQLDLKLKKK